MSELCELIAERSIRWEDEEKFSFLWDSRVAFVYYNRDKKHYRVLSYHDRETLEEINAWLTGLFRRLEEVEGVEEKDGEESYYQDDEQDGEDRD